MMLTKRSSLHHFLLMVCLLVNFVLAAPSAEAACPGTDGSVSGSQLVVYEGCTEGKGDNNADSITLGNPTGTVVGDLLIAVITIDANETISAPAGWTSVRSGNSNPNDQRTSVFQRTATSADNAASTYTFNGWSNEDTYAYLMRFSSASGNVLSEISTGDNRTPGSPAITTTVDNTLILRITGVDDNDIPVADGTPWPTGHTGITKDNSRNNNAAVTGIAAYQNRATAGTGVGVDFGNNLASANQEWVSVTMGIEPVEFRFSHSGSASTCSSEMVTLSATDSAGNPLTWFTGTVTLSTSTGNGTWGKGTAAGTAPNNTGGGVATYTFVAGDAGVASFEFVDTTVETVNFNASWKGRNYVNSAYDPNLVVDNLCKFRISHDSAAGTCAPELVTFSLVDSSGLAATRYSGQIAISLNSGSGGNYTLETGNGTFADTTPNDGVASYTFVAGTASVVLRYRNTSMQTVNFGIVDSANPSFTVDASYDANLVIYACEFRISHDGQGDVCSVDGISIGVYSNNSLVTLYTGSVTISTAGTTGGNWTKTLTPSDASGTLDNGAPNDGLATYNFVTADAGDIVLNFQDTTVETVNFNIVAAGVSQPAGAYDLNFTISACSFRISHATQKMDVCTPTLITITIVNSSGATLTGYSGTVNLSTTTARGNWAKTGTLADARGTLTDTIAGDGAATYSFLPTDNGTITLRFTHPGAAGVVNINVSDGVTLDARDPLNAYDKSITVALCTFEFSHSGSVSACEVAAVTLTVRNSLGGLAVDYEDTVTLGTSSNHGNWLLRTGGGVLTEVAGDDNGVASYTFGASDNGVAVFDFSNPHTEIVNLDAVDRDIIVDLTKDPDLLVTSCLPALVGAASCVVGQSTTRSIPARNPIANQRSRMVLMVIGGANSNIVTSASFNGQAMTLIRRETSTLGEDSMTEIWGILDANLPANAGTYTGTYVGGPAGSAMCLLAVNEVEQAFPTALSPADTGPVNSSSGAGARTTTITTQANNSLIVVGTTFDATTTRIFATPKPDALTRIFGQGATPIANPTGNGARFGGSAGSFPTASVIDIVEELTANTPPVGTQVAVAFKPLVSGGPIASGYVPVILDSTYSGNLSYRAIGSTLRTSYNLDNPTPLGCNFVNFATGTSATLNLPAGATIRSAQLYWMGSGNFSQADTEVNFGRTGSEAPITAAEIFMITNAAANNNLDYFTAYKDVTALVTGSGSYSLKNLTVQRGTPWNTVQGCAGGWALIAIYEHPNEHLRVVNLFQGFQPFKDSSFTLVPRNFRMATNNVALSLPNGQVTHVTIEGDETLNDASEGLGLQTAPNATTFNNIVSQLNPAGQEFNSTITRPIYRFDAVNGYYVFDPTQGYGGLEIDAPGPQVNSGGPRFGNSWGIDIDTHYISGGAPGSLLYNFALNGAEAEKITTRYSSGGDLVMLVSEVISVSNYPVADLEIFKTETSDFKVGGSGSYAITVTNNGDGGLTGGFASGEVIVADRLPAGMSFLNVGDVSGTGWSCSVTLSPGAFTCIYNITTTWTGGATAGQLAEGETLPTINLSVKIGDKSFFPFRNNNAKNSARLLLSGGSCGAAANGMIPNPTSCGRPPQFDNVNDLDGGAVDINGIDDKRPNNNNVDSVTTVVKGVEVDLTIDKFVDDVLESGSTGVYTLRIKNNGPDATTAPITVSDAQPAGVSFVSAIGAGWSCPGALPGNLTCTYAGSLGVGASTDILLTVNVTAAGDAFVTNSATVTADPFNFDIDNTNNADTDITKVQSAPVASQEKFLMSVSGTPGATTTIGGLSFTDDDYIIYDPSTDTATMFFDNSALGFGVKDADAVHLLKNGHLIISAAQASTIGTGPGAISFGPGDLVEYDPILGTVSLLFNGSALFGGPNPSGNNITAVYVYDDGRIEMAVTPSGVGSTIGSNNVPLSRSNLVIYNPATGTASTSFNGTSTLFTNPANSDAYISGFYRRVNPADPTGTIEQLVFSLYDPTDPLVTVTTAVNTGVTKDDIVQYDAQTTPLTPTSENRFVGDEEVGVFASNGNLSDLRIDALHVVQDGYVGHFRVSEYGGEATVCSPTGLQIRISKHEGLTHTRDSDYTGSVRLTTDTGKGNWTLVSGGGTLNNGAMNDGVAIYTYVPGDGGSVILGLTQPDPGSVKVSVTNGIAREGHPPGTGAEAPSFVYSAGITLSYLDTFSTVSYANQNGTNAWADNWAENDLAGGGAASGDVKVSGGSAVFTGTGGTTQPSLTRTLDLSGANLQSDLLLSFSFSYTNLNTYEEFVVETRHSDAAPWRQVALYKRGDTLPNIANGNGLSGSLNLSAVLQGVPTESTQIRFRVVQGFAAGATFAVDDVKITAQTNNCSVSALGVNHYEISIFGQNAGTYNGVACVAAEVTITAHDAAHSPVEPGNGIAITLNTNTARGNWSRVITGSGALANGAVNDGFATYTFPANEKSVTLSFDYTGPLTDPELVNINVNDGLRGEVEDPYYSVSKVGLRFFNSGTADAVTPIPLQIAGKPSNVNPIASQLFVQVVSSSGTNPNICVPLFSVGQTLDLGFAAQCDDPAICEDATETFKVHATAVPLIDAGAPISYTSVPITLTDVGGGVPGAPIIINYSDVGKMRLLTSFNIPLSDDLDPLLATKSGDKITANSNQFIVRPFAFDIDFSDGRQTNGTGDASYAADHTGSLWKIAGQAFDTTVTAVAWESADDTNNDGVPDSGADLSNNHPTPNFDKDTAAANYSVKLSVVQNKVPGGIAGVLSDDHFDNFAFGAQTHSVIYNEVGVIDLRADIVNVSDAVIPYLGTQNVPGSVLNVGRFYPNLFVVDSKKLNGRSDRVCSPNSDFTYMGEPFRVEFALVAKGLTDSGNYTTVNYRGAYAKLDTYGELDLVAIDDVPAANDVNYSARLANSSLPSSFGGTWNNGVLNLSGNLIFQRNTPASPDGPFPGLQIAFKPLDNDGVTIDPARIDPLTPVGVLNVDVDVLPTEPGVGLYYLIAEHEFRYGRLIVNNAYGPETEDLALSFLVEYFNGSEFVRNSLDNCTVINVADLSFVGGTYSGGLDAGETVLGAPATTTVLGGQTQGLENVAVPTDSPLQTSAPGEGNSGTVDVILNLNSAGLDYLSFEWDDADNDYNENPTGQIEFGQFRMHDRIINWQEIYNRPTP